VIENKSGINPTGHYILILPDEVKSKTDSGLILVQETVEQKERETTKGVLIAVGPIGWDEFGDGAAWAEVGDHVCYGKYAGRAMVGVDGKKYVLANAEDVLAVLDRG
jgi:co-chaperonin GroES (HSP10)